MAARTAGQGQFMTSSENPRLANEPLIDNIEYDQIVVPDVSISLSSVFHPFLEFLLPFFLVIVFHNCNR